MQHIKTVHNKEEEAAHECQVCNKVIRATILKLCITNFIVRMFCYRNLPTLEIWLDTNECTGEKSHLHVISALRL